MEEKQSLSEQLADCTFTHEYIKVIAPIMSNHAKIYLERIEENIDFNQIGSDKEIKLKEISKYFGLLQTIVTDLERVLMFLRFEKRNELKNIYPELESQEQYYIYHFENYIIRVNTITDVLGKLGNSIYETGIPKCNGYNFKEEIKKIDANVATIVEKLLKKTKEIKDRRHEKIHTGETKINYLEGVAFWGDIHRIIKEEVDPLLEEYTDKKLLEAVDETETEIRELIEIVKEFLEYSVPKFLEIAGR